MKAERLEEEFSERRVAYAGGLPLFAAADALSLIDRASEEGVPILAVHGFHVGADRDQPAGERLADFSPSVARGHGCWVEAEAVIERYREADFVYAIPLGGDPLEAV